MRRITVAALLLAATLPAWAQTPDPTAPAPPPPPPAPQAQTPPPPAKEPVINRFFFGGGIGAAFGTVDYFSISPLVGYRVVPRWFDVGVQPFYQWTRDDRYSANVSTTDYGVGVFARFRIWRGIFAEADYQWVSYEYVNPNLTTTRDNHNAFLAGGVYSFPVSKNVSFYASALYDFTYNDNEPYGQFYSDSPVRLQVGVSVGF